MSFHRLQQDQLASATAIADGTDLLFTEKSLRGSPASATVQLAASTTRDAHGQLGAEQLVASRSSLNSEP